MAFTMKLGSKNLDGPYSMSNTQTDTIKKGSGGLGIAGQVPDGQRSQGEAMSPHFQLDNSYIKTEEKEGYMGRGVTRGGKMPEVGDQFESDNDKQETSTTTTVTDQNNSPRSTPAVRGKGVKVNRTINKSVKDDRKYYPQNHPKAGQIIPPTNMNKGKY